MIRGKMVICARGEIQVHKHQIESYHPSINVRNIYHWIDVLPSLLIAIDIRHWPLKYSIWYTIKKMWKMKSIVMLIILFHSKREKKDNWQTISVCVCVFSHLNDRFWQWWTMKEKVSNGDNLKKINFIIKTNRHSKKKKKMKQKNPIVNVAIKYILTFFFFSCSLKFSNQSIIKTMLTRKIGKKSIISNKQKLFFDFDLLMKHGNHHHHRIPSTTTTITITITIIIIIIIVIGTYLALRYIKQFGYKNVEDVDNDDDDDNYNYKLCARNEQTFKCWLRRVERKVQITYELFLFQV